MRLGKLPVGETECKWIDCANSPSQRDAENCIKSDAGTTDAISRALTLLGAAK